MEGPEHSAVGKPPEPTHPPSNNVTDVRETKPGAEVPARTLVESGGHSEPDSEDTVKIGFDFSAQFGPDER